MRAKCVSPRRSSRCAAYAAGWMMAATLAGAATLDPATLSEEKVVMVEAGKAGAPGKAFLAGTVIAAPVSKVCATLLDYAGYPGFMPNLKETRVSRAADASTMVDMTLGLPLGKIKKYRLKMDSKVAPDRCQLSWKMLPWPGLKPEETIADTTGYWQLAPQAADRGKTVVQYYVYTDPGPVPTGLGWIVDSLSKDSLPKTLEALRNRVAK